MDVDAFEAFLFPGRRYAPDLAPVDAALPVLSDDRVTLGDLLLDGEAGDREGVEDLRHRALEVLTGWTLSVHQAAVDEVGGRQLVYDIEVPLTMCSSKKRRTVALFSSASDDTVASSSPGQPMFFSNGLATTSMMRPGGVWRIARRLIHRSAWKKHSANGALTEFKEVR